METKNFLNSENTVREAYEAPKCEIIEMQNEGDILVASNVKHSPYEEDPFAW